MTDLHVASSMVRRPPNHRRGEIEAELGGQKRRLVLTLESLCELEAAFDVQDLVALAERFENGRFAARDLCAIIAAGLRGAGEEVSDLDVARMAVEGGIAGYAGIVGALLHITFMGNERPVEAKTPPPFSAGPPPV